MGRAIIDEIPEEAIDIVARHTNYSKMTGGRVSSTISGVFNATHSSLYRKKHEHINVLANSTKEFDGGYAAST